MQRRSLLRLGLLASVALGAAGAGVALWTPGWRQDRFSTSARALWRAVAQAVLADLLPTDAAAREAALDQHLDRLQATVAGLPPAARKELSQLLALLDLAPSRLALTGLRQGWAAADPQDVQAALQAMRLSDNTTRQQIYHALRDLTQAAYFASPTTWAVLGYPGPASLAGSAAP